MDSVLYQLRQSTEVQGVSVSQNDAKFNIRKANSWRRTPVYNDFTSYYINVEFEFSCECIYQEWIVGPDYVRFHQERARTSRRLITIHHRILKLRKRTDRQEMEGICKAIARELTHWTVPEPYRSKMIRRAARDTMNIINSSPARHDSFILKADVLQIEFQLVPEIVQDEGMVPATDESIKKLERKVISAASDLDASGKDCMICLDEVLAGCEVVSMPCLHAFHANCIENWLKTSHYCPLCRFEMPSINDDDDDDELAT